jgi:hypothetical protein
MNIDYTKYSFKFVAGEVDFPCDDEFDVYANGVFTGLMINDDGQRFSVTRFDAEEETIEFLAEGLGKFSSAQKFCISYLEKNNG